MTYPLEILASGDNGNDSSDPIESHAIEQSRALARALQSTLPREIRDMIYEYCWDEKKVLSTKQRIKLWSRAYPGTPCPHLSWRSVPHFVLPSFSTLDIAREAAATYYRLTLSSVGVKPVSVKDLEDFIMTDFFNLGLRPGDYCKELYVQVPVYQLLTPRDGAEKMALVPTASKQGIDVLAKNFAALRKIRREGAALRLRFELHDFLKKREMERVLEVFRPVYEDLKGAGAGVVIYVGDFSPSANPSFGSNSMLNLAEVYSISREDWLRVWNEGRDECGRRRSWFDRDQ